MNVAYQFQKVLVSLAKDGLVPVLKQMTVPVDQEELDLIFTPFYRGKHSRTEGTGLGLAIAKKIITLHHGDIGARNVMHGFQVRVNLEAKKLQR